MEPTALVITDFDSDGLDYARRLRPLGFGDVVRTDGTDPLRVYLEARPELVVLDLLSVDDACSIIGSIRVGGWRNVAVPVVVVGDEADRFLEAGAQAVVSREEVGEGMPIAAMALYAERCRRLLGRARQDGRSFDVVVA